MSIRQGARPGHGNRELRTEVRGWRLEKVLGIESYTM
jgi:hypothetical protein